MADKIKITYEINSSENDSPEGFMEETSKGINHTIEGAVDTVRAIQETVKSATDTALSVIDVIQSATNIENGMHNMIDNTIQEIGNTMEFAGETVKAVTEVVKAADETIKVATETFENIYGRIEEPIEQVIDKLNENFVPKDYRGILNSPLVKKALISITISAAIWALKRILTSKKA